jgi:hypothetical protein
MSDQVIRKGIPPEIRALLSGLRWRIRTYVWLEGLSIALIWLGVTFWIGLSLDYLPVLAGVGEMPRVARLVLLSVIAGVFAFILYRWLFRRIFARLADRSMAVLLERRFHEFDDSLITAVELKSKEVVTTEAGQTMLSETESKALRRVRGVQLSEVFNFRPLAVSIFVAALLSLTLGAFYVVNTPAFETAVSRLYFMKDTKWPRKARIEVVGVEIKQSGAAQSDGSVVPFRNGSVKAAKGSSLGLVVRADASQLKVPEVCVIHYRTAEGDHGRVNMTSIGRVRDGFQYYKYDGKPLDGVLSDIDFDVVGFDHRLTGHRIQVVASPTLVEVKVACEFPAYMVDQALSQWLPRTMDYTAGMQLPQGTKITVQCRTNKPLTRVELTDPDSSQSHTLTIDGSSENATSFTTEISALTDHWTLDVGLVDTDNVRSERPYRIHLAGNEDAPPTIDMRMRGIGTSVTPDVIVPIVGKITDDYGLNRVWIEALINDRTPAEIAFQPTPAGDAEAAVDFRLERSKAEGLALQPKDKLHLTVKATDKRTLGVGPNQASGDHYELDVVTADQLLTYLESRELELRRRFEQIIEEMTETREMLARIKSGGPEQALQGKAVEPEDTANKKGEGAKDAAAAEREKVQTAWSLRLLRARQSLMQSQKSAQEVLGIAASFREIREELINNRVDTADRKGRLEEQIANPLQLIGEKHFPELDRRLEKLAEVIARLEQQKSLEKEDATTVAAAQAAIDQANQILNAMDDVLKKMMDLEDFNELLDIVRTLIEDQEKLMNEAKKEQKKAVLDLLK